MKIKLFSRKDRIWIQAQQVWLILTAHVMHTTDVRCIQLANAGLALHMGRFGLRDGLGLEKPLWVIMELCASNGLPSLGSIVVSKTSGEITKEQRRVAEYNWYGVRVPSPGTFRRVWGTSTM